MKIELNVVHAFNKQDQSHIYDIKYSRVLIALMMK